MSVFVVPDEGEIISTKIPETHCTVLCTALYYYLYQSLFVLTILATWDRIFFTPNLAWF